ncbi:hypothetical protein B0O99DRAFT_521683 [Bisporella sp. PMI_857]|nr:hypothetical protein B0O99DRAFT_521683 [Bisporella sp. PMI_857]
MSLDRLVRVETANSIKRDIAWKISKDPCIGLFDFLVPRINENLHYHQLLQRLKAGEAFLHIGLSIFPDLRQLVEDGVPSENLHWYLMMPFIDLSYVLFNDRDKLKSMFLSGNLLHSGASAGLRQLNGRMDVVYAPSIPLSTYQEQIVFAKRMVKLLRGKGSMLLGLQIGHVESGEKPKKGHNIYRHNANTFEKLWSDIGCWTGTKWKVAVAMWPYLPDDPEESRAVEALCGWVDPGLRWLSYEVVRE